MVYLVIYVLLSLIISMLSFGKRINFIGALLISLFLTPIVGLISILKTDNNIITHHYTMTAICSSCNKQFEDSQKRCTDCGEETLVTYTDSNDVKVAI